MANLAITLPIAEKAIGWIVRKDSLIWIIDYHEIWFGKDNGMAVGTDMMDVDNFYVVHVVYMYIHLDVVIVAVVVVGLERVHHFVQVMDGKDKVLLIIRLKEDVLEIVWTFQDDWTTEINHISPVHDYVRIETFFVLGVSKKSKVVIVDLDIAVKVHDLDSIEVNWLAEIEVVLDVQNVLRRHSNSKGITKGGSNINSTVFWISMPFGLKIILGIIRFCFCKESVTTFRWYRTKIN